MKQYIVDAFTDTVFAGNPAAVCVLDSYPNDQHMMMIARKNRYSETAFVVPSASGGEYHLRWFTPDMEIDFCGHATLATAYVLHRFYCLEAQNITFRTNKKAISTSPPKATCTAWTSPHTIPRKSR